MMNEEEFWANQNSQLEWADGTYAPLTMKVHMRRWRYYQELYPHLNLSRPDQAR
jgi:hypothetical protein